MSAVRNSYLEFALCLSVEFEFVKTFKKNRENASLWNVSVHTAHYERVRLLRILATDLQSDCAHSHLLLFFTWDVCVTKCCVLLVVSSSPSVSGYYGVVLVAYLSPKPRYFCLYLSHKWRDSIINCVFSGKVPFFFTLRKCSVFLQSSLFF
jgi:hypothetical protein